MWTFLVQRVRMMEIELLFEFFETEKKDGITK